MSAFSKILTLFAIYATTVFSAGATHKTAVATFANNGIDGTVTVDEGTVTINIDLSEVDTDNFPSTDCGDAGFKYHIHVMWDNDVMDDQIGSTMCGGSYTGGHYDPWQGCGSATANPFCEPDKSWYGCIPTADYLCEMIGNPYLCEIGDWSSKYGVIELDGDVLSGTFSSFYEVGGDDLREMSVVFHCTTEGAPRAFCAPFQEGENSNSMTPSQDETNNDAVAMFDVLSDDSKILLRADGTVEIKLDASAIDLTAYSCDDFQYSVFNNWDSTLTSVLGSVCDDIVGDQYDPTRQCLAWTEETEFCENGMLCGYANYTYDCDWNMNRYSCAPGDLSGKFGRFRSDNVLDVMYTDGDSLIPDTEMLIGAYSAVVHCSYEDSSDIEILACAGFEIATGDGPATTDEPGGAISVSYILPFIISVIAAILR